MRPELQHEIKNTLYGCAEIALFLKKGATRFKGTIPSLRLSLMVLIFMAPLIAIATPNPPPYEDKSALWTMILLLMQGYGCFITFAAIMYFFKVKTVTTEQYLKCISAYNWLIVPSFAINIPFILLGASGVNTWDDIHAIMMLTTLYSYSFLAFMITHILQVRWYLGLSFAVADLMFGQIIQNISIYLMMHIS